MFLLLAWWQMESMSPSWLGRRVILPGRERMGLLEGGRAWPWGAASMARGLVGYLDEIGGARRMLLVPREVKQGVSGRDVWVIPGMRLYTVRIRTRWRYISESCNGSSCH